MNVWYLEYIPLLLFVLLLVSTVGLIVLWRGVFKRGIHGDLPSCGRCGYAVRGLLGLTCPECGADLREVGIVTPKQRGSVSPWAFAWLWSLLLLVFSGLMSGLLIQAGPTTTTGSLSSRFVPVISDEYQQVEIESNGQIPFVMTDVSILGNSGQLERIRVDLRTMKFSRLSPAPSNPQTLDSVVVLSLLKNIGADTTKQHVKNEADELPALIQKAPLRRIQHYQVGGFGTGPFKHFDLRGTSMSMSGETPTWYRLLLLAGWLLIWILGFGLYFRIRRKNLSTQPRSPESAPSAQSDD
jgi:hypothetical protein